MKSAIPCAYNQPLGHAQPRISRGLKIPRRKACRFDSGPGHHSSLAMDSVAIGASLGASLAHQSKIQAQNTPAFARGWVRQFQSF